MRNFWVRRTFISAAAALMLLTAVGASEGMGDEPGRLGRLFRFAAPASPAAPSAAVATTRPTEIVLDGADPGRTASSAVPETVPATANAQPRLVPQPRVSRGATESDPILTRVTLGRSSDGSRFAIFLQVYADGTVIDGEGAHQLGRDGVRPLVDALAGGDLFRLKGHCGSPPTDSLEEVQMVVYERSLGRLRANAFSFSSNTQGCDHAVRHVQTLLENLQLKLSPPTSATTSAPASLNGPPTIGLSDHEF